VLTVFREVDASICRAKLALMSLPTAACRFRAGPPPGHPAAERRKPVAIVSRLPAARWSIQDAVMRPGRAFPRNCTGRARLSAVPAEPRAGSFFDKALPKPPSSADSGYPVSRMPRVDLPDSFVRSPASRVLPSGPLHATCSRSTWLFDGDHVGS